MYVRIMVVKGAVEMMPVTTISGFLDFRKMVE